MLVAVSSGFGDFSPAQPSLHSSSYPPSPSHRSIACNSPPSYHPETLILKGKGHSEIHHCQAVRLIKQPYPQAPQLWRPPPSSIVNIHQRRRIIRRKNIIRGSNIKQLPRPRRAKLHRTRPLTAEPSAFILKNRIRALAAKTYTKPTPRRKRSVYTAQRIPHLL